MFFSRMLVICFLELLLQLVDSTLAKVSETSYVIHESRTNLPLGWEQLGRLNSSQLVSLRIGLTQRNLDRAEEYLTAVSDPESSNYGQFWTSEMVTNVFSPSYETSETVRQWLLEAGFLSSQLTYSDNKGWIAFYARADEAESLFRTEFYLYEHVSSGVSHPGCVNYSLPVNIQRHIDYITPRVRLLVPFRHGLRPRRLELESDLTSPAEAHHTHLPSNLQNCSKIVTPDCIRALYNISIASVHSNVSEPLGLYEEGEYFSQKDLDLFFKKYRTPQIPLGTRPQVDSIDGGVGASKHGGVEAVLDLMVGYPLIYPSTIKFFATGDRHYDRQNLEHGSTADGFNTFLDAIDGSYCSYKAFGEKGDDPHIDPTYPDKAKHGYKGKLQCGTDKLTKVVSFSYGGVELELPAFYQKRMCNEFLKLGLQGHTVLVASGDNGAAEPQYQGAEGEKGCAGPRHTVFSPQFPAGCPWVTSVGATKILKGHSVEQPESAANIPADGAYSSHYSSGGGFSNVYPRPQYQDKSIETFFSEHDPNLKFYSHITNHTGRVGQNTPPEEVYNRIGRGIPDVAANGQRIAIIFDGQLLLSGGTSASTPIFSSVVHRINEHRLAKGKRTVGFINPALYKHPSILNDIINGSNGGCGNHSTAFHTAKGWDPVTGLGTPNYGKMLDYFMSLP